ncbi:T9SS type A sorting domain-containing protein [uncultured Polaribacter sp.]|uniref:T9SS type A sorting domain-containing protein n=1 Tax=uncultured Polaribacter sp. TaxID=174711 RepID=UPI002618B43E|nr:T9SS type A sorting domain-containing protein [uncultured Polaribacter sp.]
MKKITFLLLAFIGLSSFQLNAQTALTVTDVVEVQNFTVQTGGDLDSTIGAITSGTGSVGTNANFISISSNSVGAAEPYTSADNVKGTFTFTVRSTAVDVTADITLSFRKRKGNSAKGSVDVESVEAATFDALSDGVTTNQALHDITDVVLSNVTLTTTPKTIVVKLDELFRGSQTSSHVPTFRFDGVSINKTAVACATPTDVTTLAASAGAEHIGLTWVAPTCFDEVLVVAKAASAVTAAPVDGSTYTANATFGSGDDLGTSEYAVFSGTTNTAVITGLTKGGTTYHFEVFTRKGTTWSAGVTASATTNNTYTTISGITGVNWEDTSSWIGGAVPSATSDNVVIDERVFISSDVEVNDLVINERITINAGFSLTADDLAQNKQLIVKSTATAFGSVIVNSLSGDVDPLIYDRWLNDSPNNDLISSPVSGVTFSSVATNSQNENRFFINPSDATNYYFGPFNNTTGLFETYSTGTHDATVIDSGKGYRAATIAGAAIDVRFTGAILVADTDIDITDGGAGTLAEWNLIGNPYPSYLNFGTFFTANSGEFHLDNVAVYGWNGTGYTVWNGANSSDKLAPGQGFFVRTKDGVTGNVDFTTAMRTTGNTNDFVAKSANTNKALAKINLSNITKAYSTNIYFIENQTRGLDFGYDAGAFSGTADGIYTNLVENNTGLALAVQSLSYNDFNDVVVPVAINSEAGVELTISLDAASLTIPSDTYVYLKDNLLNTKTLLNDADYVFTPDAKLSGAGRFFIQFSAKALSTDNFALNELLIYARQSSKTIIINGVLKTETVAKIFDIQGRIVLEQKLDNSSVSNIVDANALNTGIYIVQLGNKTQKVIIN